MTNDNISSMLESDPERLLELLKSSESLSSFLTELGVSPTNTYARNIVKEFAKRNSIVIPKYNRTKRVSATTQKVTKIPLAIPKETIIAQYFIEDNYTNNSTLIKKILSFKLLDYKCNISDCPLQGIWLKKVLRLHLDHINGDSSDNRLENLRFLCPNCHSQTDTYTGRNSKAYKSIVSTPCERCNEGSKNGKFCRACEPLVEEAIILDIPSAKELATEVESSNINYVATKYSLDRTTLSKVVNNLDTYEVYPKRVAVEYPSAEVIENAFQNKIPLTELAEQYEINVDKLYRYISRSDIEKPTKKAKVLCACGKDKDRRSEKCAECQSNQLSKITTNYPPTQTIVDRIHIEGYEGLARELGVSGNAIRKFLRGRLGEAPKKLKRA